MYRYGTVWAFLYICTCMVMTRVLLQKILDLSCMMCLRTRLQRMISGALNL